MNWKTKKQNVFSTIFQGIKASTQRQKILLTFLILILFVLSLEMIQGTLGRLSRAFILTDSAQSAKFDVIITTPEEFWLEQGENLFEYHFLSVTDVRCLNFQVYNNGEADILCTPHINNGVKYRIYISGTEYPEFIVKSKETVNFQLLIGPEGLNTTIKDAELFVDIRQPERS